MRLGSEPPDERYERGMREEHNISYATNIWQQLPPPPQNIRVRVANMQQFHQSKLVADRWRAAESGETREATNLTPPVAGHQPIIEDRGETQRYNKF